jgi:para-aminobenzoate synthetase
MRTLLVDNYDSFTYNIFHCLADVNGEKPVVIRNDARIPHLASFDNIVLSPGPGRPSRQADFGICRELITNADLPVLGICLGHQGLCEVLGGTVGKAPEVRHGRLSPIWHNGTELLAGIPSPFQATRYHSLVVTDLPEELELTAWTTDGVVMGVRHRSRPMWGVQFHPESICTEYGYHLLRNFAGLTRDRQRLTGVRPVAAPRPRREPRPAAVIEHRLLVRSLPTTVSDEVAFDRLFREHTPSFWLDSSRPDGESGRFSIMGSAAGPGPLARTVTADVNAGTVTVTSAEGTTIVHSSFFTWLENDLARQRVIAPDLPFAFRLGWVGYLGYELKAECGGRLRHQSTEPDAAMIFADRAIVFDHMTSTTYLLSLSGDGWLAATEHRLAELSGIEPNPAEKPQPATQLRLRHDRDRYLALIDRCQDSIQQGETYEVCLTNMLTADESIEPWRAYRLMRRFSPSPFAALLQFPDFNVLSTSPERFLQVSAQGVVESKPIKGTRPRGATPAEDEWLRADLATNEKDRSENLMIVDLVRNDLGRSAEVSSVHVPKLFDVETYTTVHHLVSTIRAKLADNASAVSLVRSSFPGGSMTGAPKIRTMAIIDELEAGPRGVYSGVIGYFSLDGAADLSIVIRTAVVRPDRVSYGVGGAIVALSDPTAEFEETAVKAAPILELLSAPFPAGRTGARAAVVSEPQSP